MGSCELRLFFLLLGLNRPPIAPRPDDSPPTLESFDFLRLRAKPALSLSAGDELALRLYLAAGLGLGEVVVPGGSMI